MNLSLANGSFASHRACNIVAFPLFMLFILNALLILARHNAYPRICCANSVLPTPVPAVTVTSSVSRNPPVTRYRIHLEDRLLAPGTINVRLAAVRRLAYEAADTGLLSTDLAAGIRR